MKALILAAGTGNRLGNLTSDKPKAMVEVNGKALLEYALDFLNSNSTPFEIGIVVGYQSEKFIPFIQQQSHEIQIFQNPDFLEGSILTLQKAYDFLQGDDFLLMNVDHIYPHRLLKKMSLPQKNLSVVCDFDRNLVADDMKIQLHSDGTLQAIDKELQDYQGGYIGMTYCTVAAQPHYWEAAERALKNYGSKACVEKIIHQITQKQRVEVIDVSGIGWLEVDNQDDLKHAENSLKQNSDYLR